ncbi:MAG: LLM class flavin-dependent oxidoreductase [Actinomycetota bacterium]
MSDSMRFGLFLNMGRNLGATPNDVIRLTIDQATMAEEHGFDELWLTEHHFIPFGINPSAITAAGFLLGHTSRLRIGTAVTLSPLYHPIDLAERTALLDQLSGGRFQLGLGRGGYLKDYEVLEVPTDRWEDDPQVCAEVIIDAWTNGDVTKPHHTTGPSTLQPPPLTTPHPPLLLATRSPDTIAFAARSGFAIQHYFASPVQARVENERCYADADPVADVDHLHALIVVVTDSPEQTRADLTDRLSRLFTGGDWPTVQNGPGHTDAEGKPLNRRDMASHVAEGAIVGNEDEVLAQLRTFHQATGARRFAFFVEAIADDAIVRSTISALARIRGPLEALTVGAGR